MLTNSSLGDFIWRVRLAPDNAKPMANLVVTRDSDPLCNVAASTLRLSIDYFAKDRQATSLVMPYFIHPDFWRFENEFSELSQKSRQIRIGFAGTISNDGYRSQFVFPIMSRSDIFRTILSNFNQRVEIVHSRSQYSKTKLKPSPFVVVAVNTGGDTTGKHILIGREYLTSSAIALFSSHPQATQCRLHII